MRNNKTKMDKSIAEMSDILGLSKTTVIDALTDQPNVNMKIKEMVTKMNKKTYKIDPQKMDYIQH